jgi:hypothetical protein
MLSEFFEYVDALFPSVPNDVRDKARECIRQFEEKGSKADYLLQYPLDELSQGDIISEIPFFYMSDDGEQRVFRTRGMVISTSCDIDNHDKISLVPLFHMDSVPKDKEVIRKNKALPYMYLPDKKIEEYYINFKYICSYGKDLLISAIATKTVERVASLSQIGYYFFICKFSAFLFRREDTITQYKRHSMA